MLIAKTWNGGVDMDLIECISHAMQVAHVHPERKVLETQHGALELVPPAGAPSQQLLAKDAGRPLGTQ